MIREGRRLFAFRFNSYWRDVGTIRSYWESNLELTRPLPPLNLYDRHWRFYTQTEEMPPAYCAPESKISNSIISEGCEIHGIVENSVLFQGVHVGEGSVIKNSVVMTGTIIGRNCFIENCIVAERVIIADNVQIGVGEDAPSSLDPEVYTGLITVIGMYSKIPENTRIGKNCVVGVGVTEQDFTSKELSSGGFVMHRE